MNCVRGGSAALSSSIHRSSAAVWAALKAVRCRAVGAGRRAGDGGFGATHPPQRAARSSARCPA